MSAVEREPLPGNPPISWGTDLLPILAAMLASLAPRLAMMPYLGATQDADAGTSCLLALHHLQGKLPVFWYSQSYNGSLEALLAAPWVALLGPTVQAMAASQIVLALFHVGLIYLFARFLFGPWPAVFATLPYAMCPVSLIDNLNGVNHSYTLMGIIGAFLLLAAMGVLRRPTPLRCFGYGALLGLGLFNNPQVASFVAPLPLLALLRSGRTIDACFWRGEPVNRGQRLLVILIMSLAALALGFCLYLFVPGGPKGAVIGGEAGPVALLDLESAAAAEADKDAPGYFVSLAKPAEYLMKAVVAFGACWIFCEVLLAAAWRWVLVRGLMLGLGGLLVMAPPKLLHGARVKAQIEAGTFEKPYSTPAGLDPSKIRRHWQRLKVEGQYELLFAHYGREKDHVERAMPRYPLLLWGEVRSWMLVYVWLIAIGGLLVGGRRALLDLLLLRRPRVDIRAMLTLQALAAISLYLLFPRDDSFAKYLMNIYLPMSVAFGGGLAVALGWAARAPRLQAVGERARDLQLPWLADVCWLGGSLAAHSRRIVIFLALVMVGAMCLGSVRNVARVMGKHAHPHAAQREIAEIIDVLDARGVTRGYCNYWYSMRVAYYSGERIILREWPGGIQRPMYAPHQQAVRQALEERQLMAVFMRREGPLRNQIETRGQEWFFDQVRRGNFAVEDEHVAGTFRILFFRRVHKGATQKKPAKKPAEKKPAKQPGSKPAEGGGASSASGD